jgi:hypothetical protein
MCTEGDKLEYVESVMEIKIKEMYALTLKIDNKE